jgi:hypothetical protein
LRKRRIANSQEDTAMFIKTKIAVAAALILGAASAALANDVETNPIGTTITCPTLEGYPDCHPDGRAAWTLYSTNGESVVQKKSRAKFNGVRR